MNENVSSAHTHTHTVYGPKKDKSHLNFYHFSLDALSLCFDARAIWGQCIALLQAKLNIQKKRRWIKTSWRININIMSINMTFFNQIFFYLKLFHVFIAARNVEHQSHLLIFLHAHTHTYIMRRYHISRVIKKLYWKKSLYNRSLFYVMASPSRVGQKFVYWIIYVTSIH